MRVFVSQNVGVRGTVCSYRPKLVNRKGPASRLIYLGGSFRGSRPALVTAPAALSSLIGALPSAASASPHWRFSHPLPSDRLRVSRPALLRAPRARRETPDRPPVHAPARRPSLAFAGRVAGARADRPARVELEPVRVVSAPARLLVQGVELVWDPAGEPVPSGVAGQVVGVAVRAGAVDCPLCGATLRVAVAGARFPFTQQLVLN